MLYVARYQGQVIGKSVEFSYADALQWARPVAGYGVEIRPAGLNDLCAREKGTTKPPRTLKSIMEERQ